MNNGTQDIGRFLESCSHSMEDFQKLHMDAAKQLSQLQLEFMNLWLECNCSQMQRLAKAETPSDVVATESGIATEYMNKFASNAQQTFDTLTDIQQKMYSWMQDNNMLVQLNDTAGDKTNNKGNKKSASTGQ
ncbi:MAG: phasin family protein [Gammaproteobacteria bacterium]|nr:phasin family protein [Gammaproteobacteria bacterium]